MPFFAFLKVSRGVSLIEGGLFSIEECAFDLCFVRVSTILGEIGILDRTAGSISRASASDNALEPGSDSSPRSTSTSSTVGDIGEASG